MTVAANAEVSGMKREETLLNLVCIVVAGGFLALVLYNLFAAGSIITTDGLFMIVVPMVLALPFLLVPAKKIVVDKLEKRALKSGKAPRQVGAGSSSAAANAPALKSAPALKDAKGRPMPPDVNRLVAEMKVPRATDK
ncbi:MAG TPA: hypothetical protein VHE60_15670 [Pyrinomonadaceae bacterium]|nr:hypothetical protein [Pyrinomonadaceae bacterium]